ncbi:MAG: ABC transporter permease [Bryobacteraceae bacterium]
MLSHYYQSVLTALRLAVDSLRAHKLRTFLTLLGVIIGVSSVVLVGAAIDGMGRYAEDSTAKAFGTDSYMIGQLINVGRLSRRERQDKLKYNKPIRKDEIDYLRITTGDTILYSPYQQRTEDVKGEGQILEGCSILGVSATLPEIRDITVIDGRFFTDQEEQTKQQVAVIGDDIRAAFFAGLSPLGRTIKVAGLDFRVIGLQEKLGSTGGQSQDNQVYIPATVFTRLYGPGKTVTVFGRPRPESGLKLDQGLDLTRSALRTKLRAKPGAPDNFDFLTPDSTREFIDRILGLVTAVVVPVTSISLLVGGIVIMNIMLVSVTERTREIGIRKALGARRNDIMLQFLIESAIMASAGGAIGLGLAAFAAAVLSLVLPVRLAISPGYVFLAVFVSSSVGILSGWYPASRASKLDPVVALRAE